MGTPSSAMDAAHRRNPRGNVIGHPVDCVTRTAAHSAIHDAVRSGIAGYVCCCNVHMLSEADRDPTVHDALDDAYLVVPDGAPVYWALRRSHSAPVERVTGTDLLETLLAGAARHGWRVTIFGGEAETVDTIRARVLVVFPDLRLQVVPAPMYPRDPAHDQPAIQRVRDTGPDLLFVSLGCPKQEKWMHVHRKELPCITIGIGAALDFLIDRKRRAPVWMQRAGLEWLHRGISEPRRLVPRYVTTNAHFILRIVRAPGDRGARD